ncbi:fatty-acid--CoA ligase [Mycolicibacter engbaekii]|nr:fatty-acid--CoA ligase [Mycolicibacter engbaekii]
MPDPLARSVVLVTDYRVPDPGRVWPLVEQHRDNLARMGAHHVLVYTSAVDPGRVLAVMAIDALQPVTELLRDAAFLAWFDAVGVVDIPAVFAGYLVQRIELTDPAGAGATEAPGAVVAAVAEVADPQTLIAHVQGTTKHFHAAGIRRIWMFQAFDNPREVFMLQEAAEGVAERAAVGWIDEPQFAAEWITRAGVGVYPPVFVGRLAQLMRVGDDTAG